MKTKSALAGPIAVLLALALGMGNTLAADGTWTNNGSSNWSITTNWFAGTVADGVGATATFALALTSSGNFSFDTSRTLGTLNTSATGRSTNFIITGFPSSALTMDNTGSTNAVINVASSSGQNHNVAVPIQLMDSLNLTNGLLSTSGRSLAFNSTITVKSGASNSGNLTITNNSTLGGTPMTNFNGLISDGAGSIALVNAAGIMNVGNPGNTFSGTTTNTGGVIRIDNGLALQSSALNTSGSITGDATNGLKLNTGVTTLTFGGLTGGKNINATGTGVFSTATSNYGAVTALTLNPGTGKSHSYSGVIANGAAGMTLTKTAVGTQILSGTNTYTGATTLSAGTLSVGVSANLGDAASNLVFNGGTLQITGTTLTNFSGIGHAVSFNAGQTVGLDVNNVANVFNVDQVLNQTTGGFTKLGAGTADLNLNNIYTGATNVNAGTLNINGTLGAGANAVNVNAGAKLRFGTVSQTLGSLTIGAGSTVVFTSGLASGAFSEGGGKASGLSGVLVPEPGTIGLLVFGALGGLNCRRRV